MDLKPKLISPVGMLGADTNVGAFLYLLWRAFPNHVKRDKQSSTWLRMNPNLPASSISFTAFQVIICQT